MTRPLDRNGRRHRLPARTWSALGALALAATLCTWLVVGCSDQSQPQPTSPTATVESGSAIRLPIEPVPAPPTPEAQVDLVERLLDGQDLSASDVPIVHYFNTHYLEPLSPGAKAARDAFIQEAVTLGIMAYEFDERWREFVTPTTPEYQAFIAEFVPLLDFDTLGKDGGATIIAGAALVGGAIGCVGKAEACMDDSLDNQTACMNQECPAGKQASIDCCYEEAIEDIDNCAWTCGFNSPDPEYNSNCCKPKPVVRGQIEPHEH